MNQEQYHDMIIEQWRKNVMEYGEGTIRMRVCKYKRDYIGEDLVGYIEEEFEREIEDPLILKYKDTLVCRRYFPVKKIAWYR